MFYFKMQYLLVYLHLFIFIHGLENTQDNASDDDKNQKFCPKHVACGSKKQEEPTNFEVRALLVKCGKSNVLAKEKRNRHQFQFQNKRPQNNTYFDDQAEPKSKLDPLAEVENCDKKLKLTIKIKNTGITNCKSQYIIIDHVFDSLSERKQKILNPYVLKIKQEPVMQTYGLNCEHAVNSQATEKVLNKNDSGYTGCNTDPSSDNPTCGSVKYNNEVIPYSTGFCCSCNKDDTSVETTNFIGGITLPPPAINGSENPKKTRNIYANNLPGLNKNNYRHYEFSEMDGNAKKDFVEVNIPNSMADNADYSGPLRNANDDRLSFSGAAAPPRNIQKRGGQDCSDKYTPPDADPNTYHDSSHCLEFSDIWYSVNRLDEPKFSHSLHIQIYEKFQDRVRSKWKDLTKNSPILIGTTDRHYSNDEGTLAVNYIAKMKTPSPSALNYKTQKLLIPDTSNIETISYPELQGGPEEYLVLTENEVHPDGKTCNVAGVGYEAFVKQPKRCESPKESCLSNQPKQMWEHDHQAEMIGSKGSHFLKYFGRLPENPIVICEKSQNKTLRMYYTGSYVSMLDIEIQADSNVILRPNSLAILTEVYVDSSSRLRTSIIAKVFNSGLVSSVFLVSLADCPLDMPASFNNIVSKPVLIAPQRQHIFHLEIECPLPKTKLCCAVQVQNTKGEIIAVRNIRLRKLDRCICIWHCKCACLLADAGLKCKPISLEHYHAAGFQGGLPVAMHVVRYTFLDDMISLMLYILLFVCLTLLVIGLAKALVGCCVVPIGLWGLDLILGLPKKMNSYYEPSIRHRKVIYDESGWPIDPDTKKRVRNISLPAEFCINVVFFYIYPFAVLWVIIRKLCFSSYSRPFECSDTLDSCKCKSSNVHNQKSSN